MKAAAFACAIVSGLLGCLSPLFAATIHVPFDQPTIQAGIDAAVAGDIVVVADGTYTGPGNKDLDFKGKAITVRSLNGPQNCILDFEGCLTIRNSSVTKRTGWIRIRMTTAALTVPRFREDETPGFRIPREM